MSRFLKVRLPSASELRQLQHILETSTNAQLCHWAEILLFYAAGLTAQAIADALAMHVNTIYTCLHRFAQLGMALFQPQRQRGAPRRITLAQLDAIVRIAEQSPIDLGLPYGRWSLAKLRAYLIQQRHLLKALSREHLRRVLKKSIFNFAKCNANSSVTIHNGRRFWLAFARCGDGCRLRG